MGDSVIAVCGVKNSGKTTLLERLVTNLTTKGLRVAVIKHDGHDFTCDVPGTDSDRLKAAGAYGTAVVSKQRLFLHKTGTMETPEELIALFPEADLIFIEGMKNSMLPKIEIIRSKVSTCSESNPEGRFLIVTDLAEICCGEPVVHFDGKPLEKEVEQIVEIILRRTGRMSE